MQVSSTKHVPVRATAVSVIITCLVSLINIGSTAALNAIVSLGVVALLSSYYITIACLVRHSQSLSVQRTCLGEFGDTFSHSTYSAKDEC